MEQQSLKLPELSGSYRMSLEDICAPSMLSMERRSERSAAVTGCTDHILSRRARASSYSWSCRTGNLSISGVWPLCAAESCDRLVSVAEVQHRHLILPVDRTACQDFRRYVTSLAPTLPVNVWSPVVRAVLYGADEPRSCRELSATMQVDSAARLTHRKDRSYPPRMFSVTGVCLGYPRRTNWLRQLHGDALQ
ncbi:hypothetical protein FA95DRAFT_1557333 [Auriscalpium vulgare]|uniref:Uncharacterized protein n=1 Tax=Auriscalpium vulgare TaxID=40419 RepID=A0ACB8RY19_9AGAM|nr:hypothetical protein FA95DRAFT_1557333 [Auriscalpium vulgare]